MYSHIRHLSLTKIKIEYLKGNQIKEYLKKILPTIIWSSKQK